jgi:hypothetical protein
MQLMPEIPVELLQALSDSAMQDGCSSDLIVVSSTDLAAVLSAAGLAVHFETPNEENE